MKAFLSLAFILSLLIAGCNDSNLLEDSQQNSREREIIATHGDNLLYFSSFETEQDMEVYTGNAYSRGEEAADGAGDWSMVVCGGCIAPHCTLELGPFDEDKQISLGFWAKCETKRSASLSLRVGDNYDNTAFMAIDSDEWTYYELNIPLDVPANKLLALDILSGGLLPTTSQYDLLHVFEVE